MTVCIRPRSTAEIYKILLFSDHLRPNSRGSDRNQLRGRRTEHDFDGVRSRRAEHQFGNGIVPVDLSICE